MIVLEFIAWGSTILAALFLVLMIFGVDDLFGGMFETRVVAFFGAGLGWGSVIAKEAGYSLPAALFIGVALGSLMGLVVLAMVWLIRRASSATEPSDLSPVGKTAEVSIAPDSSMLGMVRLIHRGHLTELPAKFESFLPSGSRVFVTGSAGGRLSVRPLDPATQSGLE